MGLFSKFTSDPTDYWPAYAPFHLTLDLRDWSLAGLHFGDHLQNLHPLGKPDNASPFARQRFVYQRAGCLIEAANGWISYFAVATLPDADDELVGVSLDLVAPSGEALRICASTSLEQLRNLLGSPAETDIDDEEIIDYHDIHGHRLEVEATVDGRIKRLNAFPIKA